MEQLTPLTILHLGGSILPKIVELFTIYMNVLIKALSCPSEDDNITELKDDIPFRAETDAQQLALLGIAYTVAELVPMVIWRTQNENKELGSGTSENIVHTASVTESKEWRRSIQHSVDELRDHFCRQYVLNFIYSREGKTQLNAHIYLNGRGDDLLWDSGPLPSLPFQVVPFL